MPLAGTFRTTHYVPTHTSQYRPRCRLRLHLRNSIVLSLRSTIQSRLLGRKMGMYALSLIILTNYHPFQFLTPHIFPVFQLYLLSEFVTHSPAPQTASSGSRSGTEKGPTPHSALSLPKADPKATRPDGTRLHCLAISRYCFKIGRLTVPPRIAMAICGFGPDRSNWLRSASMQEEGTLRMFLEGGWRKERGWELGEYEEKRAAGMVWCEKLKEGITALADW